MPVVPVPFAGAPAFMESLFIIEPDDDLVIEPDFISLWLPLPTAEPAGVDVPLPAGVV